MSIKIQFLLPNQQHIATKLFDKSISICQIFEDIHLQYDFFDEEYFHLEWSVYSSATNRYIGYETITLQEILPDYQEDTFVFLDSNITGLKLSHWFQRASNYDNSSEDFTDEQIHQLQNTVLEGCVLETCEDYHKSINEFLSALEINLLNEQSILGIAHLNKGKALNKIGEHTQALDCLQTAISLNPQLQSAYNEEKSIAEQQLARKQQQIEQQQNQQQK